MIHLLKFFLRMIRHININITPNTLKSIALVLFIGGGFNRGLIGLFNFDLIAFIFGYGFFTRIIYILVGLATVYILVNSKKKSLHKSIRK